MSIPIELTECDMRDFDRIRRNGKMINKKLLAEILNTDISEEYYEVDGMLKYYVSKIDDDVTYQEEHQINLYELANLCKRWVYDKYKICLMSTLYSRDNWVCTAQGDDPFTEADTEREAIFKAVEWIYNDKIKENNG